MSEKPFRLRFAPSPTGPFHIGCARSALFNWLLARQKGGQFVLRIEDTDLERSTKESEENIMAALKWLGMAWDEGVDVGGPYGPYRQTERLGIYQQYTDQLLSRGQAYRCYCTEEELEAERQQQMAAGENPHYSGKCRHITAAEQERFVAQGRKPAVRFKVPENKEIVFKDMVRGLVTFDSNGIGDYVIVKSDGIPVYNYGVVLDDALMEISHVIRAEEHLSNTPRQILLYEALQFPIPQFGHISLILGTDRTKMSKRHGATSVDQYRELGYLPEALVNFLALLGWSPASEEEIFSVEQLIEQFSMDRVAKNPAVFDIDKLNHINAQYLKKLSPESLLDMALPHLRSTGYVGGDISAQQRQWLAGVVAAVRNHISFAAQITDHIDVFFNDQYEFESDEARQVLLDGDIPAVFAAFTVKLNALEMVDSQSVQGVLKSITKELKLGGKKVFMPVRIALTGKMHGPELIDLIPLLGKERTLARIATTMTKVSAAH